MKAIKWILIVLGVSFIANYIGDYMKANKVEPPEWLLIGIGGFFILFVISLPVWLFFRWKNMDLNKLKSNLPSEKTRNYLPDIILFGIILLMLFGLVKCVKSCSDSIGRKPVFDQNEAMMIVEMALKKNLNDPDSYDRVEQNAWLQDEASHRYRVRIVYRAKNAFGGVITNNALFEVDSTYIVRLIED